MAAQYFDESIKTLSKALQARRTGTTEEIIKEIEKRYKGCVKYCFNNLAFQLGEVMHSHYVATNDIKKVKSFSPVLNKLRQTATKTQELRQLYNELRLYANSMPGQVIEINKPSLKTNNIGIKKFSGMINVIAAYQDRDFEEVVKICEDVLDLIGDDERGAHFYATIIPALISLSRYEMAQIYIEKALQNKRIGSDDWMIYELHRITLLIHQGRYKEAFEALRHNESKRRFKSQAIEESYLIIKGYLYVLSKYGVIETGRIQVGRLINSFELYTKDKKASNINIIIIECLLRGRDYTLDRTEAIEKYYKRYTISGSRNRVFLQTLLRWARHDDFIPPELSGIPDANVEVVPFNDLIDLIRPTCTRHRSTSNYSGFSQ